MRRVIVSAVLVLAMALGGCAAADNDYPPGTAAALQSRVLVVSEAAEAGDLAGSLQGLSELEVDVMDAVARGLITQARHDSIAAAIQLVRQDLEAAIQAAEEAAQREAEENEEKDKDKDNDGNGNGNGNGNDNDEGDD